MKAAGRSTAAALILLFALVSAVLAAIIVPSVLRWSEDGRTIRENREKVAAVSASQQSFIRLKNSSDRWAGFSTSREAGFLDAPTSEDALAAARAHVIALIEQNGGTLNSFEAEIGDIRRSQVEMVTISMNAFVPRERLAKLLAVLEDAPPFTFVRSFTISPRNTEIVTLQLDGQMQRLMEQSL